MIYLLVKSGIRARVYGLNDEFKTFEEARAVADRLNYQTSSTRWSVSQLVTANR